MAWARSAGAPNAIVDRFRRARRDRALAVVEGFHALKHALRFGAEIVEVVAIRPHELEELARALAPELHGRLQELARVIDERAFGELAPRAPSTGVIALARRPPVALGELLDRRPEAPVVLLEEPRDLNNVGATIRVAAAAQAAGVIVTGRHDPWHPDAIRGAAGLHWALPVVRLPGAPGAPGAPQPSVPAGAPGAAGPPGAHAGARPLVALDPEGEPFQPRRLPPGAILAFGSERRGLSQELRERADACVAIPMADGVSSLNLATSVSAVLYAWRLCASRA
ncbi:MAG: hypothetical protein FWD42_05520 [Solirubrobacterales bacterium]|nr:hypothetical protein [Solirubrobacterales bacterium]